MLRLPTFNFQISTSHILLFNSHFPILPSHFSLSTFHFPLFTSLSLLFTSSYPSFHFPLFGFFVSWVETCILMQNIFFIDFVDYTEMLFVSSWSECHNICGLGRYGQESTIERCKYWLTSFKSELSQTMFAFREHARWTQRCKESSGSVTILFSCIFINSGLLLYAMFTTLNLKLLWLTKTEFHLTLSLQYQADKWWE